MIRNFKRTAAIFGIVAATSTGLVACSESGSGSEGGSEVSGDLTGEGASSQKSAMSVFEKAFLDEHPDANFSYTSSGSGAGVEAFTNGTVDFAGSDSALKEDKGEVEAAKKRCEGNDAWHLPTTIGPVAIAYNLGDKEVNLKTETLAKIFKGEITKWNDEEIKASNEGVDLPDTDITVIFRSDESGTSDNFQKFLKTATGNWDNEGKQFPDAVGEGANGSSGVADQVASIEGAITYVEAGYNMVVDSEALFGSDTKGSYPLILTTYNIVCSAGYDEETSALVKAFFKTVLDNQSSDLESAGFIPVTGDHLERLKSAVDAIQ